MPSTSRANALRIASLAHETGAEALRGVLRKNEDGRWTLSYVEIESWLSRYADAEVVLVVAPIEQEAPAAQLRTCRTCGNEYAGPTCPRCEEVRTRLRRK